MSDLKKFKRRIETDVLAPLDKIKLDEEALKKEIEEAKLDYATMKKAVKAELALKAGKAMKDAKNMIAYLDA